MLCCSNSYIKYKRSIIQCLSDITTLNKIYYLYTIIEEEHSTLVNPFHTYRTQIKYASNLGYIYSIFSTKVINRKYEKKFYMTIIPYAYYNIIKLYSGKFIIDIVNTNITIELYVENKDFIIGVYNQQIDTYEEKYTFHKISQNVYRIHKEYRNLYYINLSNDGEMVRKACYNPIPRIFFDAKIHRQFRRSSKITTRVYTIWYNNICLYNNGKFINSEYE